MSEYPAGSTAKVYYDSNGNPTTLYRLIREEPDWARSRVIEGERAIAEIAALKAELARARDGLSVIAAGGLDGPTQYARKVLREMKFKKAIARYKYKREIAQEKGDE